jgi:hypothetical protein
MTCTRLVDSGAYVLGALSPSERFTFERHMATCAECQAEVNDLAVLPGLLSRIDEPTAVAAGDLPTPTVLPRVLARVHKQRRGRRVAAFAAGLAVACIALVAGLNLPSNTNTTASNSAPSTTTQATVPPSGTTPSTGPSNGPSTGPPNVASAALHPMQPVATTEPIAAQISLNKVDGGTKILMKCQYPAGDDPNWTASHAFKLLVYPKNGHPPQQVDAWWARPGQNLTANGMTAWSPVQIARVELQSAHGNTLLVYHVPA